MKKIFFFLFSIFAVGMSAQITITSADIAAPSKQFYQATDTIPTIAIGAAGTNQVWNMASLKAHKKDTLTVLAPGSTPYAAKFPASNLVYKIGTAYLYLTNSATDLSANGIVIDPTLTFFASPAEMMLKYPATYGTAFTGTSRTTAKIKVQGTPSIDSAQQKSVKLKTSTIDAWGSITTPYGTYNCLRMKEIAYSTDSIFFKPIIGTWILQSVKKDSSKTYSWLANNIGVTLVSVGVDFKTDVLKDVNWLVLSGTMGISKNVPAVDVNVYPNPAQNEVQFGLDASRANALQIFDAAGRMVYSAKIVNALTRVDVSALANGIYSYTIIGKENQTVNRGKLNVVH